MSGPSPELLAACKEWLHDNCLLEYADYKTPCGRPQDLAAWVHAREQAARLEALVQCAGMAELDLDYVLADKIRALAQPAAEPPREPLPNLEICPHCGSGNWMSNGVCPRCGKTAVPKAEHIHTPHSGKHCCKCGWNCPQTADHIMTIEECERQWKEHVGSIAGHVHMPDSETCCLCGWICEGVGYDSSPEADRECLRQWKEHVGFARSASSSS